MIEVQVESAEQWESLRAQIASHGGALVRCPVGFTPDLYATVEIVFVGGARAIAVAAGQVVHASGAGEIALTFPDDARTELVLASYYGSGPPPLADPVSPRADSGRGDEWGGADTANVPVVDAAPEPSSAASDPSPNEFAGLDLNALELDSDVDDLDVFGDLGDGEPGADGQADSGDDAQADGNGDDEDSSRGSIDVPLWKRYQEMNKAERMKLARQGGPNERRMVLKDRDSSLHLQLLNNAGMKGSEIAAMLRSGAASGQFLRALCERGDLVRIPVVAEALVFHPQTPVDLAERLVERISLDLCRRIAKQGQLKNQIVAAAKKRVLAGGR